MSFARQCIGLCAVALAACGPFTTPEEGNDSASAASPGTAGGGADPASIPGSESPGSGSDSPTSDPSGGAQGGGADAGTAPQDLLAKDLQVKGVSASIIYAHNVHARDLRCGRVIIVADSELPKPGKKDIRGDVVVSAAEAHVHDIEADWVEADTLYARSIGAK